METGAELDGAAILITGGTGSFGQRFARTVLGPRPPHAHRHDPNQPNNASTTCSISTATPPAANSVW